MTAPTANSTSPRLRLRVTAAAESILRAGHPWLFADSVREQNRAGQLGELAVIFDRQDRFLAVGLYDPDSPIRVRLLHAGKPQTIDRAWWHDRLRQALALRAGLFDGQTTGRRLINGESDGWPGLVLDQYDFTLVLKLYTAAWLPQLADILELLGSVDLQRRPLDGRQRATPLPGPLPTPSSWREGEDGVADACCPGSTVAQAADYPASGGALPYRVVLRLSRNIQAIAKSRFHLTDGQILRGPALTGPVIFRESGLQFEADVLRGQKTGFFLDQRENRRRVESLARGRTVLNAFSFSGGFSVYAAQGGARSVTDLDLSKHALESAGRNFRLNASEPVVAHCPHATIQADAFDWLDASHPERFDLVILDPPSLAKREVERAGAINAYGRLATSGIQRLNPGGILLAASCSAHVAAEEFFASVRQSATSAGRKFKELQTTRHAADHPAKFKEMDYLKAIYLEMD